jgi:Arc/MetJ family transcription regulator
MKRTQIYLDEDVLKVLKTIAKQRRSTVSDLVRGALREKFLEHRPDRAQVLLSVVGAWGDRKDLGDSTDFVRGMRKGTRAARLSRLSE